MLLFHSRAAVLSIGDEIIRGQLLDTNSRFLTQRLLDLGIETVEHATVGDDRAAIAAALRRLAGIVPLVIATGGLGPTADDLTRDAFADVLAQPLITDERALADLAALFKSRNRSFTEIQRVQALRPTSARCLPNSCGTAPGLHGKHGKTDLFLLPGPPAELTAMFERSVVPLLRPDPAAAVNTRILHCVGIGEADAAAGVADAEPGGFMRRDRNPLVGITASGGIISWRIRYRGPVDQAAAQLDQTTSIIRTRLGPYLFAETDRSIAQVVLDLLRQLGQTLAVVESCTGGLLGEMITAIPGSSDAFRGGFITYSNDLKASLVNVKPETLAAHGAVSRECAQEMAEGGLARARADFCLSITGIAGPDGGTPTKPVGTVYIGLASAKSPASVRRFLISGTRKDIRERAAVGALGMLFFALTGQSAGTPRMLWEQAIERA